MLHVFCYHRVVEEPLAWDPWDMAVTEAHFAEHLRALSGHMELLNLGRMSLGEAFNAPEDFALITFDDIYFEVVSNALPTLEELGASCLLFIAGSFLNRPSFWWDELQALHQHLPEPQRVKELGTTWQWLRDRPLDEKDWVVQHMAHLGRRVDIAPSCRPLRREELADIARHPSVRFGAHTMTHPWLPALGPDEMRDEVERGRELLKTSTGQEPLAFAYPFGGWNDEVRNAVAKAGYTFAFTTQPPPVPFPTGPGAVDFLTYPRTCVGGESAEQVVAQTTR